MLTDLWLLGKPLTATTPHRIPGSKIISGVLDMFLAVP